MNLSGTVKFGIEEFVRGELPHSPDPRREVLGAGSIERVEQICAVEIRFERRGFGMLPVAVVQEQRP